jgi:hypothetical protein
MVTSVLDDATLSLLGHRNCIEFCRETARWSGTEGAIVEEGGLLLFACGSTFPVSMNGVYRLDPDVPADEVVARADAWFGERRRGYTLSVNDRPGNDDTDLRRAGEAAGLLDLVQAPAMFRRAPIEPSSLVPGPELRWVTDRSGLADFIAVNEAAYATLGLPLGEIPVAITDVDRFTEPHIGSVVAYLDGVPSAAAQLLLSHGIGGVYWVGTVESARGKGLGEVVTRAVTNRAFELGAAAVTLQASSMGEPIYARLGYETLYRYHGLVRWEPTSPPD